MNLKIEWRFKTNELVAALLRLTGKKQGSKFFRIRNLEETEVALG
ncbi:hypothetical protein [Bacteroides propionicifaciens]|nr:hypothetical protein [Bacteroides propionicifaciens]